MTKEKMIKVIDALIADEQEAIEQYNKAINDFKDSSRLVSDLGMIYQEETRHISNLNALKKMIEEHSNEEKRTLEMMLGSMPVGCYDDGIVIDEEEGE